MRLVSPVLLVLVTAGCATGSPRYLAKVNDEEVTGRELRQEFARSHVALDKYLGEEEDVRRFLDRVVKRRLFIQEGYRMGLQDDPAIQDSVARTRDAKMVELFVREEVLAKTTVSDEEVAAAYAKLSEQVDIRQVVVGTKEEAEDVRAELKKGADIQKLARERSIAPSASRGGLTVVTWGTDEDREKAVAGLKDGELTPVFRSSLGWEVARVDSRKTDLKPTPLEKLSTQIKGIVERRKRVAIEKDLYATLYAKYEARVLDCVATFDDLLSAKEKKNAAPCASWRGGTLTAEEFAKRIKLDKAAALRNDFPRLKKALLEDLLDRQVIALEADARGYGLRQEVLDKVKAEQDDLVESELYKGHVTKGITASEDNAKEYYESHKETFVAEARYELAQVVVATEELAKELDSKVKSRQPFEELARAYATDMQAVESGGYVGFVPKSDLKGEFAPVAALAEDEVSEPIKARDGYHVVKVLRIEPERQRPFEEVKEDARKLALQAAQEAARDRWMEKLRAAAHVEISDRGIRKFEKERLAAIEKDAQETRRRQEEAEAKKAAAEAAAAKAAAEAAAAAATAPASGTDAASVAGSPEPAAAPDEATPPEGTTPATPPIAPHNKSP